VATFWERLEWFLKWLEHGYLLVEIAGAIGLGRGVQALLAAYTKISAPFLEAIWWLAAAGFMGLFILIGRAIRNRKPVVVQTTTLTTTAKVSAQIETFRKNLDPDLLKECEDLIQAEANGYKNAAEREAFLLHGFSTTLLVGFFDVTWHIIFGSQIRALERLNKGTASLEQLRVYYNQHLEKRPQYPFESWFGYMKDQTLLRQDGHNIQITVRGKAFLKYLVQYARTADDKAL
jgi:hypothetical protein